MFCHQCGTQLEDGLAFCTNCGAKQQTAETAPANNGYNMQEQPVMDGRYVQPDYAQPNNQPINQQGYVNQGYAQNNSYANASAGAECSPKNVSFGEAIKLFFVNYVNFNGRSTKSEYWWAFLFNLLVSLCTAWIPFIGQLISLGFLIPGLSLFVRRMHDTGKSWVYIFMGLIPVAGAIILIVRLCKDSDVANQWGLPADN